MGEFIDDIQHAIFPTVMGAVLDKVIRPDVIGIFRAQPRRSDTFSSDRTCSMQARRRAGLQSFAGADLRSPV